MGLFPREELESTGTVLHFELELMEPPGFTDPLTLLLISILQRRHMVALSYLFFCALPECLQAPFPAFNYAQGH